MEPGAYSLTVLVRRVEAKATYDSFVKTNTFWIKEEKETSTASFEKAVQGILSYETTGHEPNGQESYMLGAGLQDINVIEPLSSDEEINIPEEKLMDIYYENLSSRYKIRLPENWTLIEEDNEDNSPLTFDIIRSYEGAVPYIDIASAGQLNGATFGTAKEFMFGKYIEKISKDNELWKEISSEKISIGDKEACWSEYSGMEDVSGSKVEVYYLCTSKYTKLGILLA